MENSTTFDTSIFDTDDNTSASKHDEKDNENNIKSMHDISSAGIVEFGFSESAIVSDDNNNTNPVSSIVHESNDVVGIDEKRDRHSEDISAIEVASEEIGLIKFNYDSKNSGCDALDNNNSNDVIYDSLINDNVCIVVDDNKKRIEEEAAILLEELTQRTVEATSMNSRDEVEEDGEEIGNFSNIKIPINDLVEVDISTLRDENGYGVDINITSSDGKEPTNVMEIEINPDDMLTTEPEAVQMTVMKDFDPNYNPVNRSLHEGLDEPYLDSCLASDPSEYNENDGFNENAVDQDTEPIREEVFRQIYLNKKEENMDIFNDEVFVNTEVFSNGIDEPHIPTYTQRVSEIIVLFPHLRTPSGKTISLNDGDSDTFRTVRSETEFNVPFRGEKPIRSLSTSTFELLAQKYLMRGRFVTGIMSLNGVHNDISKKWCYILRKSEECKEKQWRYNVMVDKQPCQLSFQVIEDPTAVERWETSTFELMNSTAEKVQFESEWVLINCSDKDIEMFTAHQNEVIELSYKQQPDERAAADQSCAVS